MFIKLQEALERIDKSVTPLPAREIPLADAAGCVTAADIVSPMNIPSFDNSAMDGIALRTADLPGTGPWILPLQETISAGDSAQKTLEHGHAVKIMTGAPLPVGADSILPVEEVEFLNNTAHIQQLPGKGDFIRTLGSDVRSGDLLFPSRTILKPTDTGILAAVGFCTVRVIPRPSIAILSTGSELVPPGEPLIFGQVYNSNITCLEAILRSEGFTDIHCLPPVSDDRTMIAEALAGALRNHQVVISSGGVSMGDRDYIPDVIRDLGGEILFHKVRIKPGKPALLARFRLLSDSWLVGLPGNPVSVVVGYHLYARRVLRKRMHLPPAPKQNMIPLGLELSVTGKRLNLVGVRMQQDGDHMVAIPAVNQASGKPGSIRGIDGFIRVEPGEILGPGTMVNVEWLPGHHNLDFQEEK